MSINSLKFPGWIPKSSSVTPKCFNGYIPMFVHGELSFLSLSSNNFLVKSTIFPQKSPGDLGMGQYLLIPFLVGWTSIYQLFWGSLGTSVLTHPHLWNYPATTTSARCVWPKKAPVFAEPVVELRQLRGAIDGTVVQPAPRKSQRFKSLPWKPWPMKM